MTARVKKVVRKFRSFKEDEEAGREFYRSLTGVQRVDILLEVNRHTYGGESGEFGGAVGAAKYLV